MKKILLGVFLTFLVIFNVDAKGINPKDYQFYSKDIGVAFSFPQDWGIYTQAKNAPDAFKGLLQNRKNKNDSPLFLGMKKYQNAFKKLTG